MEQWELRRTISLIRSILEQDTGHSDREHLEGLIERLKASLEEMD